MIAITIDTLVTAESVGGGGAGGEPERGKTKAVKQGFLAWNPGACLLLQRTLGNFLHLCKSH